MKLKSFEAIVGVLNEAKVRYLVVGGLAVNAHGYSRFTNDVDLVVRLTEGDILGAFAALGKLGYSPRVPITAREFANPTVRRKIIAEKNMLVLQMWSDKHLETPVDIFVREPFAFVDEYRSAFVDKLPAGLVVKFVSLNTLIRLKRKAGRAMDKIDVEHLVALQKLKPSKS